MKKSFLLLAVVIVALSIKICIDMNDAREGTQEQPEQLQEYNESAEDKGGLNGLLDRLINGEEDESGKFEEREEL